MQGNNFTIVDSISLCQFDYQSSLTSLPHSPSSKFQSTRSVTPWTSLEEYMATLTITPRPLIIPSTFTAFENNTRINRPKSALTSCSHKINSGIEDSTSLYQFKPQSDNSDYPETNSIKTCYYNPPNSPTRKHSVLTLNPSCQPNRPLTSLPPSLVYPSPSTQFQTKPLVTITPAPRTLINAIPFETTTRTLTQSPNGCTFTALENHPRIKRPKSSFMPHMHGKNFTIVDSISLSQFDYQSGLYPETDSIKTDCAFTALENNPRIKRPKSSSKPHMRGNNFTVVDSIVHIPLPI